MKLFETIVVWYTDLQEEIIDDFSPGGWQENVERERPFPSVVSALFRLAVKYFHFVLLFLWVVVLIGCIVEKLSVVAVIITSIVGTVLAAAGITLVLFIMMVLESFAKIFAGLILNGDVPGGDENPIDCFITQVFRGDGK